MAPVPGAVVNRRGLIAGATALTGAAVGAGVLPASLRRRVATTLADPSPARLRHIEHIGR